MIFKMERSNFIQYVYIYILYIIYYILYIIYCILHIIYHILYITYYISYIKYHILYITYYISYTIYYIYHIKKKKRLKKKTFPNISWKSSSKKCVLFTMAISQASTECIGQYLDRWHQPLDFLLGDSTQKNVLCSL